MYTPQRLPLVTTDDGRAIADYTERELVEIARQFYDLEILGFKTLHSQPDKPREGRMLYADGSDWDPGYGRGPYIYRNGLWLPMFSGPGTPRHILTSNQTFWVRNDGGDSNSGLANSAGGAFLTWNHAISVVCGQYDFAGKDVTIQGGTATTYNENVNVNQPWTGGGTLTLLGDVTTLDGTNTYHLPTQGFNPSSGPAIAINCTLPGVLTIRGFKINTTSIGQGILHSGTGVVHIGSMQYDTCTNPHHVASGIGGLILFTESCTISGNSPCFMRAFFPNVFEAIAPGIVFTVFNGLTFGSSFAEAVDGGVIYFGAGQVLFTLLGAQPTGLKFTADAGTINSNAGGPNYFPGSAAGIKPNNGIYI